MTGGKKSVEWNNARHTIRCVFIWLTNVPVTTVLGQFYDWICLNALGKFFYFYEPVKLMTTLSTGCKWGCSDIHVHLSQLPTCAASGYSDTPGAQPCNRLWSSSSHTVRSHNTSVSPCCTAQHLSVRWVSQLHWDCMQVAVSTKCCIGRLTFARHRLSPLAAFSFTSSAYFLHNGRQWQWICEFYTANFKGIFGGL